MKKAPGASASSTRCVDHVARFGGQRQKVDQDVGAARPRSSSWSRPAKLCAAFDHAARTAPDARLEAEAHEMARPPATAERPCAEHCHGALARQLFLLRRPFALGLQVAVEGKSCDARPGHGASTQSDMPSARPSSTSRTIGRCSGTSPLASRCSMPALRLSTSSSPGTAAITPGVGPADDDIGHRRIAGLGLRGDQPHGPAAPRGTSRPSALDCRARR